MGTILESSWGTAGSVLQIIGVVAVALMAVAAMVIAVKRRVTTQALEDYKNLAASRLELYTQERTAKEHALTEIVSMSAHLSDCEKRCNDITKDNLRLNARMRSAEDCINSLERALNRPETDFDDPFKILRDSRG